MLTFRNKIVPCQFYRLPELNHKSILMVSEIVEVQNGTLYSHT